MQAKIISVLLAVALLWACETPDRGAPLAPPPGGVVHHLDVFYATDRTPSRMISHYNGEPFPVDYRAAWAGPGNLSYGKVLVSLVDRRRFIEIDGPRWWLMEFSASAPRFASLADPTPLSGEMFNNALSDLLGVTAEKAALVFVPGHDASFADGVMAAARLSHDLGFDGATILYSWPSAKDRMGADAASYGESLAQADRTVANLKMFLDDVLRKSDAEAIHIIAYGAGTRPVMTALSEIGAEAPGRRSTAKAQRGGAKQRLPIGQVALLAPDIAFEDFLSQAESAKRGADRLTVYINRHDPALALTRYPASSARLGEATGPLPVADVDFINASAIRTDMSGLDFPRYGDHRSANRDLRILLEENLTADARPCLADPTNGAATTPFWALNPSRAMCEETDPDSKIY